MERQASSAAACSAGPRLSAAVNGAKAPIRVQRMEVHQGHLICRVLFDVAQRTTSPELMARVLPAFPALPQHACVNERGTTFAAVMSCTPLPHLLEHMVVDLQVRQDLGRGLRQSAPVVGTSEWLDEAKGAARIDVSFSDDLAALRAMRDAVAFLNEALESGCSG